jgi:mxaJ protein
MGRETRRNPSHHRERAVPSRWAALLLTLIMLAPRAGSAQQARANASPSVPADEHVLRVCADPDNLPSTNRNGEGFDNKIAALLAKGLGDSLAYVWWPERRGFIRNTLRARECDLVLGLPVGYDPVLSTKPYYRSTYYLVYPAGRQPSLTSLDDSALKRLRIGVNLIGDDYAHTPPVHALLARGISANVVGYSTFYGEDHHPGDIIAALERGDIDVAIAWGPVAGYFAKQAAIPLTLVPLPDDKVSGLPFVFDIGIGVRRSDRDLKARLDDIVDRLRPAITGILEEYHVPTVTWPTATAPGPDKR